ncbi:MAG: heavy metal translocating P-type ATPase, partial [Spirochaetia bacterium]|nr:heavy metal translocating P-type ATPase [Spirochaetia bacterium]
MKNEIFVEHRHEAHTGCETGTGCAACETAASLYKPAEESQSDRPALLKMLISGALLGLAIFLSPWLESLGSAWALYAFLIPAYFVVGYQVLRGAFQDLVKGRLFNELFLMSIASLGAFAIGEPHEAVAVMLFYTVGEWLQERAVQRSRRSIAGLMDLRPEFARVVSLREGSDKASEVLKAPEDVRTGEFVEIRPGERVPLDGVIVDGSGLLDTSSLTGESLPLEGSPGTAIKAGYVSQSGRFVVRVSAGFGESSVARILKLAQEASERKAPAEKFITKVAAVYTPVVVGAATLLAIVPPLIIPDAQFSQWFRRALVLLVISCPCALVISIPLGYFGGVGAASRRKILVKGAGALDSLLKLHTIAFDKTGTLTEGRFKLTKILPEPGFDKNTILGFAAAAERFSSHPLALALQKAAEALPDSGHQNLSVNELKEERGLGVSAIVKGKTVLVGSLAHLARHGVQGLPADFSDTAVFLAVQGIYAGCFSFADTMKLGVADTMRALKALGVRRLVMLSGDRNQTAGRIAAEAGMDGFKAELLPEDKLSEVEALKAAMAPGEKLAFVGDGMNDSPVLAGADVGVAMGGLGSDAAIEAADIVIMDDDVRRLPDALKIA